MHIRHQRLLAAIVTWLLVPLAIVAFVALVNAQHAYRKQKHGERQWSQSPPNSSASPTSATGSPN